LPTSFSNFHFFLLSSSQDPNKKLPAIVASTGLDLTLFQFDDATQPSAQQRQDRAKMQQLIVTGAWVLANLSWMVWDIYRLRSGQWWHYNWTNILRRTGLVLLGAYGVWRAMEWRLS
jgi:hypothetical protein